MERILSKKAMYTIYILDFSGEIFGQIGMGELRDTEVKEQLVWVRGDGALKSRANCKATYT